MKKFVALSLISLSLATIGCAHPGELGWTPVYTARERGHIIARNWDYEGKQTQDDLDHLLLLRPAGHLTLWDVR